MDGAILPVMSRQGGATPSTAYAAVLGRDSARPRGTPADAFRAAVRAFEEGPRLDMGRLAARLGIAKATLYRWTGSREQLIGEVISYLSEISFDQAMAATTELGGVERVMAVYRQNVGTIVAFEPLRRFVRSETPLAIRVLTLRGSVVEATVSRQITDLLEAERRRGSLTLRAPAADVAYAIVKVTEGFIYADPVAEIEPDIDTASGIVRLLLE